MEIQSHFTDSVFDDFVRSSSLSTVVVNREGTIRSLSPGAVKLFGVSREEALGAPISALCSIDSTRDEAESLVWCTVQGGPQVLRRVSKMTCRMNEEDLDVFVFRMAGAEVSPTLGAELQDAILEIARVPEIGGGDFLTASMRLVQQVAKVLKVERVSLWLLTSDKSAIECVSLYELSTDQHSSGLRLGAKDYPRYFEAFESGRAIAADDACTDPRTSEFAVGYLDQLGISSMLDSIIRVSGEVMGVVCHEHVGPPRKWRQDEIVFAAEVADLAAHAYLVAKHRETERARAELETELHQAQKLEAIGRLAGGVAHDFNNLLSIIMGHAEIAKQDAAPGVGESLERIEEAATRAAELTQQLLSIGRRQVLQKDRVEINGLVRDVLKLVRSVIPADLSVEFNAWDGDLEIHADRGQVEQAIMNLCLNAKDALPSGGKISLWTRAERGVGQKEPWVVLGVTDDGMGMSSEVADRIFEPFYSTKGDSGGTGLGLSMVYGIVRQHGGFVGVKSALDEGTTIELKFPQLLPDQASGGKGDAGVREGDPMEILPSGLDGDWGAGRRLLLAEDSEQIRALMLGVFEGVGFDVVLCKDGGEAIRWVEEQSEDLDLVVLDVIMPRVNGPDAARRIRGLRPEVPIVFCTGYGADALAPADLDRGDTYVLHKPSNATTMLQLVAKALKLGPQAGGEA